MRRGHLVTAHCSAPAPRRFESLDGPVQQRSLPLSDPRRPDPETASPSLPDEVSEELGHLERTRRVLLEHPPEGAASEREVLEELVRLQEEFREAKAEDKGSIQQQLNSLAARLDTLRDGRKTEQVDPDSPYFAHLQLAEEGRSRDVFLGRATRLSNGLRIVDWRNAPISKLFYRYQEGDEYYEEFGDRYREGVIAARRSLHVKQGELLRVDGDKGSWLRSGDGDWRRLNKDRPRLAGGEGAALRSGSSAGSRLGSGAALRKDKHLPDIAALIDTEQFELITQPSSGVVVLRGSAGSGKTTVALHRIAYLSFAGGRRFPHGRVLVIVWGRAMRDYVQHVLPALGVEGVQVTTWADWSLKALLRHFPMLPRTIAEDTPEPVVRMKLHPGVSRAMDRLVRSRKAQSRPESAVDDWAQLITDRRLIKRAMGDDISDAALDRAIRWNTEQVQQVVAWMEGDQGDARLDTEDAALLLRAYQLRVGRLRQGKGGRGSELKYVHMVLDEVQDFSPVEVQVLLDTCNKDQSVTLAGDTQQHISQSAGFSSWSQFLDRIGVPTTSLSTLEVSYRSTHPIIRFALDVLGDGVESAPRTMRDGPPVELFRFSDHGAAVAFLVGELGELVAREPLANIALLTPTPAPRQPSFSGLSRAEINGVRLVERQKFAFAPGIDVVEADQVKGLEFDYVVIVEASARHWQDTPHHRRLMHVAATRAVHQLWVTSVETPSPILPEALDQ